MIDDSLLLFFFFCSSRRRHTRFKCDWSSDVCSSDLYTTLEYDLTRGERGRRDIHAESLLKDLTGAEAALVVNNTAAAVLLAGAALASRRKVVVSRSQLIEIGGGFRIPEVLKQSGARMVEVGTTNRTHRRDFEAALSE